MALLAGTAAAQQTVENPIAKEAGGLIERVWQSQLRPCGTSSYLTLDGRVVLELDRPQIHLAPTKLQAPARQNGYEYQATTIVSAHRWRWAPLGSTGALAWSQWQEGQTMTVRFDQTGGERGQTTVKNAVLQFDLVRRNGTWLANRPLSPLNSDYVPLDPLNVSPTPAGANCARLTRAG